MQGLAPDGGLYLPITLPMLPAAFFEVLPRLSFPEIAYQVSRALLGGEMRDDMRSNFFTVHLWLSRISARVLWLS
jgi:threonine synthase